MGREAPCHRVLGASQVTGHCDQGEGQEVPGLPDVLVPWERDSQMPLTHSPLVPIALTEDVLEVG